MAMTGTVIPKMARVSGNLPSTVDRMLRDLRVNKLVPMGKHGRGQDHGQFDARHLANVVLAFAASLPSGATEAVRALNQLHAENLQGGFATGDIAEELGANLVAEIQARASLILDGHAERIGANEGKWELTLCLNPVMAWETWSLDGIERHRRYRKLEQINLPAMPHPQEFNPGVRKLTVITMTVVNAAAELCADTRSRSLPKNSGVK